MAVQFMNIKDDGKKIILDVLGYEIDKDGVVLVKSTKQPHICPITQEKVFFKNASILPWNSSIVINTSALSISEYLSQLQEKCG